MRWKPNVTVAGIIEHAGRFLLIEEQTSTGLKLNQPAGHLEDGESLLEAVAREVLEETACHFTPQSLIGVYQWRDGAHDRTFMRFSFAGSAGERDPARALDTGIERTLWMTRDEVALAADRHRSPWVLRSIDDYLAGDRIALGMIHTL
jgi:8-oxo-dGTP pyrophosphatase MutT (NUDIX family)